MLAIVKGRRKYHEAVPGIEFEQQSFGFIWKYIWMVRQRNVSVLYALRYDDTSLFEGHCAEYAGITKITAISIRSKSNRCSDNYKQSWRWFIPYMYNPLNYPDGHDWLVD